MRSELNEATSPNNIEVGVMGNMMGIGFSHAVMVVGSGDVFRRCYIVGNDHLPLERRLRFALIIDIAPEEQVRKNLLRDLRGYDFGIRQLLPPYQESFRRLIRQPTFRNLPILIATPTQYHVPYAKVGLEENHFVAIEKPIAACREHLQQFQELIYKYGKSHMFLFAYYLLEKGLPLMVWSRQGHVDPFVESLLTFDSTLQDWQEARLALGEVLEIYGVILEGKGSVGRLDQRPWVLEPDSGGNTLETFYHLVCLSNVVVGLQYPLLVQDVCLARHDSIALKLGSETAETLTWASMKTGAGAKIELLAAKYVPPQLHQRWVVVKCERGLVKMDLEAQQLQIRTDSDYVLSIVRYPQRYTTQFMLLTEKLRRPGLPIEDTLLLQSLTKTLEVREAGLRAGIASYSEEEVVPSYMSSEMSHYLIRTPE
jgi:hypothetical protein